MIRAAIDAARGDMTAAACALGLQRRGLNRAIAACGLGEWVRATWPPRAGRRSVAVAHCVLVTAGIKGYGRKQSRLYALACGHSKAVKAVGKRRRRVVCDECKAAKVAP